MRRYKNYLLVVNTWIRAILKLNGLLWLYIMFPIISESKGECQGDHGLPFTSCRGNNQRSTDTHNGPKAILGRARGEVGSLGDG